MKMRTIVLVVLVLSSAMAGQVQAAPPQKLQALDFTQVTIDDPFWSPRLDANRIGTLAACFQQCDITGRIANFAKAANRTEGSFKGLFFNDSDVYKVLEGAAHILSTHPDPVLEKKIDEIIGHIAAAQQPNGYLNTYHTLVEPDKKWADLAARHELYCAGHLIEAAIAHHKATGKKTLLNVAIRLADHIYTRFCKQAEPGYPGHAEIELALVKLYRLTSEERYLKLSRLFVERRGKQRIKKNAIKQAHAPVREQSDIRGHAVRAMYFYSGVADLALLAPDEGFTDAMERIWRNLVHKKMYITGGIGNSRKIEGFAKEYYLPNDNAYAETCASIGMALWNHRLNLLHGEGRFADVVERVLYNGILAGVSLDGRKFFYVNPLSSEGSHHRQPWYKCACCPTNIMRFLPTLGGYVYAYNDTGVWVNLYLSNKGRINLKDVEVTLRQETRYPWKGTIKITVEPDKKVWFNLNLRIPEWCRSATCDINGQTIGPVKAGKGYLVIAREWRRGDVVTLDLAMPIERIEARMNVKANIGRVALQRGPVVYCLEDADHSVQVQQIVLPSNAPLSLEFRKDLFGGVTALVGQALVAQYTPWNKGLYRPMTNTKHVPLTAIPYYAWDHREPGHMAVWIPESVLFAAQSQKTVRAGNTKMSASHCYLTDSVRALNDEEVPAKSDDHLIPRFTWLDHKGTAEWVAYQFKKPAKISQAEVYWFDDRSRGGGCRVPQSWRLLYKDANAWKPVGGVSHYGTRPDQFNRVAFDTIKTRKVKIEVQLQPGFSGGILEWRLRD